MVYTSATRGAGSWRAPPLWSCCASAAAKAKSKAAPQAGARPRGGAARGAARGGVGSPRAKTERRLH
eukprot:scaffold24519_cov60-Phaeocystis_antarctica.AAC.4